MTEKASQPVAGPGFRFEAPAGWSVRRSDARVSASHGSELVHVATFRLVKPYVRSLFAKVAGELETRMKAVARQSGGALSGRGEVVSPAGIRSHSYRVAARDHVDQYTFVLRGKREYLLLCRRRSSSGDGFCRRLITSFRTA